MKRQKIEKDEWRQEGKVKIEEMWPRKEEEGQTNGEEEEEKKKIPFLRTIYIHFYLFIYLLSHYR